MQIIDQTEQRSISAMQYVFWGTMGLITLKKVDGINRRLEKARADFKEASDRNRV